MLTTTTSEQVEFFEKKIEELEAYRERTVASLGASLRSDRANYLTLDSIESELRRCRRSLEWITGDES